MPITFYPHEDDLETSTLAEKLEVLMEAAERFKAVVLDAAAAKVPEGENKKRITPRDMSNAYNWGELAKLLREIRELPEANQPAKIMKADHLKKLAEVYEVLRAAKMPKLEAVRIALMNESNQLRAGSA